MFSKCTHHFHYKAILNHLVEEFYFLHQLLYVGLFFFCLYMLGLKYMQTK